MKTQLPIVAIDFDGVINDYGQIMPLAAESVARIVDMGFRVIIHTLRARTPSGRAKVAEWLDLHDIPYHEITAVKPNALLFIDDKALRFVSWQQCVSEIEKLMIKEPEDA